jgi:hypothetical protein
MPDCTWGFARPWVDLRQTGQRSVARLMSTSDFRHLLAAVAGGAIGVGFCVLASRYFQSRDSEPLRLPAPGPHPGIPSCAAVPAVPSREHPSGHQSAPGGDGGAHSVADYEGDEVLEEQFTRNVQFFGSEGQRRAARAFVVVVGLGVRHQLPAPKRRQQIRRSLTARFLATLLPADRFDCRCARILVQQAMQKLAGSPLTPLRLASQPCCRPPDTNCSARAHRYN